MIRAGVVVGALAVAGALVVCAPRAAWAEPRGEKAANDQRARELFQRGDAAYAEGRYEEALAAFKEAYDLSGRPQLLFNVSNALERLGRYTEAVDALEKYLASGKVRDRDVVQKRLASVRKRADEQRKKDEEERKAREEEEKKQREAEEQRRAEANAKPNGADKTAPPPPPPSQPAPIVPIVLLAGGGALLVTGGVFAALTLSARSDASAACTDSPAGRLCSDDARGALDREKTFGVVADLGILTGLVAGGIGAYLLVTNRPAARTGGAPSVRAFARSGGGGVDVVGSF